MASENSAETTERASKEAAPAVTRLQNYLGELLGLTKEACEPGDKSSVRRRIQYLEDAGIGPEAIDRETGAWRISDGMRKKVEEVASGADIAAARDSSMPHISDLEHAYYFGDELGLAREQLTKPMLNDRPTFRALAQEYLKELPNLKAAAAHSGRVKKAPKPVDAAPEITPLPPNTGETAERIARAKAMLHEELMQWKKIYAPKTKNPELANEALDELERKGAYYFEARLPNTPKNAFEALLNVKKFSDLLDHDEEKEEREEKLVSALETVSTQYVMMQKKRKCDSKKNTHFYLPKSQEGMLVVSVLMEPAIIEIMNELLPRKRIATPATTVAVVSTVPVIAQKKPEPVVRFYPADAIESALAALQKNVETWKATLLPKPASPLPDSRGASETGEENPAAVMPPKSREEKAFDALAAEANALLESAWEQPMEKLYPQMQSLNIANREIANHKINMQQVFSKYVGHDREFHINRRKAMTDQGVRHDQLLAALLESSLQALERTTLRRSGPRIG